MALNYSTEQRILDALEKGVAVGRHPYFWFLRVSAKTRWKQDSKRHPVGGGWMNTGLTLLGAMIVLSYCLLILSAIILPGWLERRRRETGELQGTLTGAIDAEVGPIVAPVVKRPFWGPWRIEIAVPLGRADTVGRILARAHKTLSAVDGMHPTAYRLVLAHNSDAVRFPRNPRPRWLSAPPLAGGHVRAA
jgi:hypothetical protein